MTHGRDFPPLAILYYIFLIFVAGGVCGWILRAVVE